MREATKPCYSQKLYVAVRMATDDGHEFLDVSTFSSDPSETERNCSFGPGMFAYEKCNPVIRIDRVLVVFEETYYPVKK